MTAATAHAPTPIETDPSDQALLRHVRPPAWKSPAPAGRCDLGVVGGGTAGLVSAIGAAGLGARVALVERTLLGGDCLDNGRVPSKGVIRASRAAHDAREGTQSGVEAASPRVGLGAAMARMRRLRAGIAHGGSAARAASLGVDAFIGEGFDVDEPRALARLSLLARRGELVAPATARALASLGISPGGRLGGPGVAPGPPTSPMGLPARPGIREAT